MPRISAIFANIGFCSHLRDDGSDTTRFRQPDAKFLRACRAFDVDKLNILNVNHEFICENIPWFEDDIQAKTELRTYLSSAGDLRATPHPADFWFAAAQQFPTRNSSGDELANVNFLYVDIVGLHALK